MPFAIRPKAGDWVEVRSKDEILRTLDRHGRLNELPFMPQMFKYCGQRFHVLKSAHKTCDTISGNYVGRKLDHGIHLDLRCDGKAYGGCQAACLIFWHEDWLKPVAGAAPQDGSKATVTETAEQLPTTSCTEADVERGTRQPGATGDGDIRYLCQATHLLQFTRPLRWYDPRQYAEDYRSGNASLARMLRGFLYVTYNYGSLAYRGRLGAPGRWLYNAAMRLTGGVPYPRSSGLIPAGQPTPLGTPLNLQAGDLVRVKTFDQIRATIDTHERNLGMAFDAELVPYCGGTYRVRTRVEVFVDEKTGKIRRLKTPAVILEGVYCQSRYSSCRMFCPRAIPSWWREIWLDRADP